MEKPRPNFIAIIDSREKKPLRLEYNQGQCLLTQRGKLYTGDYSILGLQKHIAIERKSLDDLMMCIGKERKRFEKEIIRLQGYEVRAIVVEATWEQIERGEYRAKIHPNSAIGSLLGWIAKGIPIIMAGSHERAGTFVARMLMIAAKRRLDENKFLEGNIVK